MYSKNSKGYFKNLVITNFILMHNFYIYVKEGTNVNINNIQVLRNLMPQMLL